MSSAKDQWFRRDIQLQISPDESILLNIDQKSVGDVGCVVWDSALVFTKFIEKMNLAKPGCFYGRHIIELGAGTGVCSLALAALGANVLATDLSEAVEIVKHNIQVNRRLLRGSIEAVEYCWGSSSELHDFPFNIVFTIDCIYYDASLEPLLRSLIAFAETGCTLYLAYEVRDIGKPKQIQEEFMKKFEERFSSRVLESSELHEEFCPPDIIVLEATLKHVETE